MVKVRVGFLSDKNYFDQNAWSGIVYYMHQALLSTDLAIINLGKPKNISMVDTIGKKITKRLLKKDKPKVGSERYFVESQKFAQLIRNQLSRNACDAIFAPVASKELYFLETTVPILYLSGMTFKIYKEEYKLNLKHDQKELEQLDKQERVALSKATRVVYPSDWPVHSAIHDYQVDPNKIRVIPYGANLEELPLVSQINSYKKQTSPCSLLFVGKDWQRKGGDIAFQTLISLLNKGIDTELIIVGCVPPAEFKHDRLKVIPYLDKSKPKQKQKFYELFLESHFFIFPTRAEAFGVVNSEANAFGLPVMTTEVGGIPNIVRNGKNGYMFPVSASGEDFANLIAEIFSDQVRYKQLVRSSREEYDSRLNWNKWAENIQNVTMEMINTSP